MITPLLKTTLDPLVSRQRLLLWFRWSATWLLVLSVVGIAIGFSGVAVAFAGTWIMLAAIAGVWFAWRQANRWEPDYRGIARQIEEKHPDLHTVLLTAVEQEPDRASGSLNFLQQRVIVEATAHAREQQWIETIPSWKYNAHVAAAIIASFLLIVSLPDSPSVARSSGSSAAEVKKEGVAVTPGDVSLERGTGLVVLATFHRDVPGEATLVIQPTNEPERRIPLVKNLDDPVFGGGLPEVNADLTYRVEYAAETTRDFKVRVFEQPRLERADATLHFPEYTKLPDKTVPDTRRIAAVEGTKVDFELQLNKPVKSATLVAKDGRTVPLSVASEKPEAALRDFALQTSGTYELRLTDADGRESKVPAQFAFEALPNRRPELKFAAPKGDQRVTSIQELTFRAETWDDFGLARYGLSVNVAGRGETDLELGRDSRVDERREFAHLLKLEELGVKPDELVSWFLWAEDTGPDGKPRRTASDMFFAEVRPFEEIYRPGDGQEGGQQQQGGGGSEANQAAHSQKEIISASWNIKRAEDGNTGTPSPSEKYLKDTPVVRDAQAEVLKKATALAEKVEDPKSRALVDNVVKEMQTALERLEAATKSPAPLPDAIAAEQAAYNALLKLAAHEFRVTRRQNSQGGGGGEQANQQQLDQLELKDEKQRYETKREAAPMQNEQQREQLAILNRLKELAQRQQDINERVKELQTAMQEAKTEQEKEELRRQLKRLREEEQELLADMDETRQKMEQSPQQSQLADERRKLDETRSEAQQAAEAMESNSPSRALASGTRAARNLEQMRDDFRKKTSGQFNEEMREMRADARELAQNQQEIAENLKAESSKPERRTLDGSGEREELTKRFETQQAELQKLTENMRRVSDQAEAAEPLLAKELYDALRKNAQAGTDRTLGMTQQLAERGYASQAQKFEEKARQEIEDLKSGVERAAESVLGDEAEALRLARAELDALNDQVEREIADARPDLADASRAADPEKNGPRRDAAAPRAAGEQQAQPGASEEQDQQSDSKREGGEGEKMDGQPHRGPGSAQRNNKQRPGENQSQGNPENGEATASEESGAQTAGGPNEQRREGEQRQRQASAPNSPPGQGGERRNSEPGESSPQPGDEPGQAAGQESQTAQNSSQGNQSPGSQGQGARGADAQPASDESGSAEGERRAERLSDIGRERRERGGIRSRPDRNLGGRGGGSEDRSGPLTGEDFAEWSDRLRNVEEMIDDPGLRADVARVREVAKGVRVKFKRHSVPPNWEMVKTKIGTPLAELRNRLTEELARRESKENLVPIDRDPVPTKYAERVRKYYEELGRGR